MSWQMIGEYQNTRQGVYNHYVKQQYTVAKAQTRMILLPHTNLRFFCMGVSHAVLPNCKHLFD